MILPRLYLVLLLSLAGLPMAAAEQAPPRVMLATVYEAATDEVVVGEYWVSEKLDGVRGHWTGSEILTRGGHRVQAPTWYTEGWPSTPMDGELWIERGRFAEVSGIVRSESAGDAAWRRVRFMVFDLPAHGGPFEERVAAMRELIEPLEIVWLQPVAQSRVATLEALEAWRDRVVAAGGEGLMLHHREALYQAGRSADLLKYKPYQDAEARVVGHTTGKGRFRGMLGALIVERPDGLRFRLGTGFNDVQRRDPPPVGSWVTYRYNGLTVNGVPRFARFLRVREHLPPPDPE